MNDLTVFSKDLIPVYTTSTGEKVVIGRELHDALKIGKDYSTWFKDMCGYGFSEGNEFSTILGKTSEQGGRPKTEHILKLDMAKHIAMIQRTPEGKAIRQKLIELETNVSELSPTLQELITLKVMQKQQAKLLAETNARIDHIGDVIALDTRSWRKDAHDLIVGISRKMGGMDYMRDVQSEIFKLVDQRGGVSLKTRLTNKRQRMPSDLEIVVSVYGPYLTVKEIAECIKCDYQKALLLVNSGEIRSSRTGKNGGRIISAADLVSYIRENRKEIA